MKHSAPALQRLLSAPASRFVGFMVAALLVLTPLALVATATSAAAAPPTVGASVDGGRVLAGETETLTLRASNTGGNDGYNLALYLDLPVGVDFDSSPLGDPVIYDDTYVFVPAGMQRWVWEDVSDLPPGGHFDTTVTIFPVQPVPGGGETADPTVNPVGADVVVNFTAALSGDPRYLPVFGGSTGTGGAPALADTGIGTDSLTLDIVSLLLDKSEPSPEGELLRGVHDQTTVYTLTVRNTTEGPTENVALVDFLPAALEFLGCGGVDNSTVDRDLVDPAVNEYEGAPGLDATPTLPSSNCDGLVSVSTVAATAADASNYGVTEGAVYTRVEWDLGTIAAGDTVTIRYRAGIPLFANSLTWDGPEPTDVSLEQMANLDNNNGPSTRQGSVSTAQDGQGLTNRAGVSGDYLGVVRTGTDRDVQDTAGTTVTAMDLAILKNVAPGDEQFVDGQLTGFELRLRGSEYVSSSDIVITDTVPNGLCPLLPAGVTFTIEPGAVVGPECEAVGAVTGAVVESATAHPDGTFTVVFRPTSGGGDPDDFELAPNSDDPDWHVITYTTHDRNTYIDSDEYGSTTSGDRFGNNVEVTGVTTSIDPLLATHPDDYLVWDDSSATLTTELTTISKKTLPRSEVEPDLGPGVDPCTDGAFEDVASENFRYGDTICFELRVDFPSSVHTRNPIVTDFLPDGLTYLGHEVAASSTVPGAQVVDNTSPGDNRISFTLGAVGSGGDRYIQPGRVFVVHVWALVTGKSDLTPMDKPANLMKYRQQNVQGELFFLRDEAPFDVESGFGLVKGVQSVEDNSAVVSSTRPADSENSSNGTTFGSNRDGIMVAEGERVTYRIDLTAPVFPVGNVEVWDLLPEGITKAVVSGISDGGVAYDPGDGGYPAGMGDANDHRSVIIWTGIDVPEWVPPAVDGKTLTYEVLIPVGTGVSTSLDNTASTIRYSSDVNGTTTPHAFEYVVADSLDEDASENATISGLGKRDDSGVYLDTPEVDKTVTSPVGANNAANQVVKGEHATSSYSVTIPAHTTVHGGVLSDAIANAGNWTVLGALTTVDHPGGSTGAGDTSFVLGAQTFAINTTNGTLTFPAVYSNTTDSDQVFTVHQTGYINPGSSWTHSTSTLRNNTATFSSTGNTPITATAGVYLITPNPSIAKLVDDDTVTAGQTVTFTLTARNSNNRPTLFDTEVVDCVPVELVSVALGAASQGSASIVPDASCAGTRIVWQVGSLAGNNVGQTLVYTAVVSPAAAGGATYTNPADLRGYTLDDPLVPRAEHTDDTEESVTVVGPGLTKNVDQPTAVVGQERQYVITATIPANVNFYDTYLVDTLPAGMGAPTGVSVACEGPVATDCLGTLEAPGTAMTTAGQTHGWWLGDITAQNYARTLTITYTSVVLDVPSVEAGDVLTNTVRLRWNTEDRLAVPPTVNTGLDQDAGPVTASVTVLEPLVGVVKKVNTVDLDTVEPGEVFTYTVQVSNTGTSTAHAVEVEDTIPTGVVVDPDSISDFGILTGAHPTNGGGTIVWAVTELLVGPGNSVTFSYEATLAPSTSLTDAITLTNTVEVTEYFSHPGDGAPGYDDDERRRYEGDDDTAAVTALFPDPQITKAPTGTVAYIGENHTFTITVTNAGTGVATEVEVVDVLPTGWEYVANSAVMSVGPNVEPGIVGQTLTWDALPDLAATGVLTIQYQAVPLESHTWTTSNTGAAFGFAFPHVNEATVTAKDADGYTGNADRDYEDDTSATVYIHRANLELGKTHTGDIVAGANTTWTLTVTNNGPDAAVGPIVITDQLPDDAVYVSITGTGWSTSGPDGDNELELTHAGPLASGGSLSVQVTVSFAANTAAGTNADNSACVEARTLDLDEDDNCAVDTGSVITLADLVLTKNVASPDYTAGGSITWTVDVSNLGPSISLSPIVVRDTLPTGLDLLSVAGSGIGWNCDPVVIATRLLECEWAGPDLGVGDSLPTLNIDADVLSGTTGVLTNTATVYPTTDEPGDPDDPTNPAIVNNTDSAVTGSGDMSADLVLTKTIVSTDLVAGGEGRYRITVENLGPSDALNVRVTDTLPTGLSYVGNLLASTGATWTCEEDAGDAQIVNCELTSDLGTLTAGDTIWFEFDVAIAADVTGTITNVAVVTSDTDDPDPTNNEDDVSRDPLVETNVSITKVHDESPVYRVGDEVTFTITVSNWGLADAADLVVTDTIPTGMTFVRTENDTGWTVVGPTAGVLTLELDDPLPAGTAITPVRRSIDVVVELTADSLPNVTNEVTVTTSTEDTDPTDDADDDTVPVYSPDLEIIKSASTSISEGGETFTYTLAVRNVSLIAHADDVVVADVIPSDLRVVTPEASIGGVDWTCTVIGADGFGYGGMLECELATLAADSGAPDIVFTVQVHPNVARDAITNSAVVSSNDEHADYVDEANEDEATVQIRWIAFAGTSICRADVPYFEYTIDPRNLANGLPITLTWYPDADADGVADGPAIATQTLPATTNGLPISDEILWPGAEVDIHGVGIAWPGWRTIVAGETPDWENQIEDPTLLEHPLRAGSLVTVTINPESSVHTDFPPMEAACEIQRDAVLSIDKSTPQTLVNRAQTVTYTLVVTNTDYGATNDVTLRDEVPAHLKVVEVNPAASTDPTIPDWQTCTVTGQDAGGYGGVVECVLDGWLGYDQTAPAVEVLTTLNPTMPLGAVTNIATVEWTDPDEPGLGVMSEDDNATIVVVLSAEELLALTGLTGGSLAILALALLAIGVIVVVMVRRRES